LRKVLFLFLFLFLLTVSFILVQTANAYSDTATPSFSTTVNIRRSGTLTQVPVSSANTTNGYCIHIGPAVRSSQDYEPVWAEADATTTFSWSYSRKISYLEWNMGGGWSWDIYSIFISGTITDPIFSASSGTVASGGTSGSFVVTESGFKVEEGMITTPSAPAKADAKFHTNWNVTVTLHWTELFISASRVSGAVPLTVQFTATATDGVAPYTYSWNFGGQGSSSQQNPSFTFNSQGAYNVTCTATDSSGVSDTEWLLVTASSLYLTVQATSGGTTNPAPATYPKAQGEQVTVTAVPDGGYALDKWQLDGVDSGSTPTFTVIMNANHTLKACFTLGLTVSATASPLSGPSPLNVSFTSTASGGVPPYSFVWNFGDLGTSTLQNPHHSYAQPGSFTATVVVTDSLGKRGLASVGPIYVTSPFVFALGKDNDISVVVGKSGSAVIRVTSSSSAVHPVSLSIGWVGLVPAGASAYISPTSGMPNFTSILSFTAASFTPVGTYNCRVVGTAGNITRSVVVYVTVAQQFYTLNIQSEANGTTSPPPGAYNYPAGASATVESVPDQGYISGEWLLDGAPYSSLNPVTIVMNANHTLKATFVQSQQPPPSSITFDVRYWNGLAWNQGDSYQYGLMKLSGDLSGWVLSSPATYSVRVGDTAGFQFVPRNTNGLLVDTWGGTPVAKVYSASLTVGEDDTPALEPSEITYPDRYALLITTTSPYTARINLKWVDYPVHVSANAPSWGYAVVSSDSPGFTLYPSYPDGFGTYHVDHGYSISVKAYPYTGYYFDRMVVDGIIHYSDQILIEGVREPHEVSIYFSATPPTFLLNISATYGGTTIPSPGIYMVPRYSYQTVTTLLTDPTYYFSNWVLDGLPGGAGSNITVYMDADHNLSAIFDTEYINPDSITVAPCDVETGLILKRAIIGEYLGTNITGKLPGISSPTPITVTAWLDQAGAWYWDAGAREIVTSGVLKLRGEITTNSSGWFTMKLGSMDDLCWMGRDAPPGSSFLAYAEIHSGSEVYFFNGSWRIDNVMTSVEFGYDLTGINASFHLLFTDGTPVKNRAGSFITAFKEVDLGWSTSSDDGGVTLLRIPYSKLEGLPYREGTWTVATYTNRTGSPSLMTWFKQCNVRFTELAAQFLMHNETHLAVEVFDWGSPYHHDVAGVSAYLWWDSEFHPWDGKRGIIPGCPFGPSDRALLERTDADCYLKDSDGSFWRLGDTVNIPDSCSYIESAIFITHPNVYSLLHDPNGPEVFYLRLIPPHSMNVLYSPARTGTILLAASVRPPAGW